MFADKILINIGELFKPIDKNRPLKGEEMNEAELIENAFVAIKDGLILEASSGDYKKYQSQETEIIDLENKFLSPGLIDAHTHFVFGGSREHEFSMKLNGLEYLEILKQGGGIINTVTSTRETSFYDLYEKSKKILDRMLSYGVTAVEGKSGYGLDFNTEIKQLQVMQKLNENHPIDLAISFMAAHAVPPEYKDDRRAYIDLVKDMIPYVAENKLASHQDVFCEDQVFTKEESIEILKEGNKYGLKPRIHADEVESIGGIDAAVEVGAVSCEHLMATSDQDMKKMAENNIIANLLPSTTFSLMKTSYARSRDFLNYGNAITICSDFNPGSCPCENLQMAMFIAVYQMKLTPVEVMNAVTINAAHSTGLNERLGSLERGKEADLVVFDAPNLDYVFYNFGVNNVVQVYKKGKRVI